MLERRELMSFAAPVVYPLNGPQALVTADMNGDGRPDLISLVNGGAEIAVQLANTDGSFGPAVDYSTGASGGDVMTALAVGDVTGDGKPDIVVSGWDEDDTFGVPYPVSLLVANSKGGFTLDGPVHFLPSGSSGMTSLALADFDGDGYQDLVAADNGGRVFVVSDIGFLSPYAAPPPVQTYNLPVGVPGGGAPFQVAVGDFNGDGKPDIVAAGAGSVVGLLNNGNGTFGAAQPYTAGGSPASVAVGDFNGDGKPDIVTAGSDGTVSVLLNNGNGAFGAPQNDAIGGPGNSAAVGDFNHDGYLDVATTGAEMDVLLNNGDGTFGAYQKVGPAGNNVVAADFNGDGFPDLAQIDAHASPGIGSIDVVSNHADWMPGPVSLSFGAITYNSRKNVYSETVTLTNITSGALTGPLSLELTNLLSGVVLTDATGTTNGHPYIRFLGPGKTLKKGASVTITLTFTAPSPSEITFGTAVAIL